MDKREVSGWTKRVAGWPVGRAGPPKPPALKSGDPGLQEDCHQLRHRSRVSREVYPQIMWLSRGAGGCRHPLDVTFWVAVEWGECRGS